MKLESHCLAIRSRQSRAGWKPAPTLLMHQSGECRYPWDAFPPKCRGGFPTRPDYRDSVSNRSTISPA